MKNLISIILLTFLCTHAWAQTIPNDSPLFNQYNCNGVTTQFPYSFYITSPSDMVVYQTDNYGNITAPTNFSVDTTNVWVNYPLTGSACPSGYTITLVASTPITQTTTYSQRTPFTASAVGNSLNKLTVIDQQLQGQINRALLLPVNSTNTSPQTFPTASPGMLIGWNSASQLANIANPSAVAQWTLTGANISYNTGNVSTTNNMTATYFDGILNGNINWPAVGNLAQASNVNWPSVSAAQLQSSGINWYSVPTASLGGNGVNWSSMTGWSNNNVLQATTTGVNWTNLNSVGGMSYVQKGTVSSASSFTIPNLSPGINYKLIVNLLQNTSPAYYKVTFNGDTGNNYSWTTLISAASSAVGTTATGTSSIVLSSTSYTINAAYDFYGELSFNTWPSNNDNVQMFSSSGFEYNNGSAFWLDATGSGLYTGSSQLASLTFTPSAGSVSGTWVLYQLN